MKRTGLTGPTALASKLTLTVAGRHDVERAHGPLATNDAASGGRQRLQGATVPNSAAGTPYRSP